MTGPYNPPAFPHVTQSKRAGSDTIYTHVSEGMTLRDWFAGQVAAQAISLSTDNTGCWNPQSAAMAAYEMADAMLAARSSK